MNSDHYSSRLHEVQIKIEALHADGILISYLPNIRYLTGFTGSNAQLIITLHDAFFLSDGRYDEQAHKEVTNAKIRITSKRSVSDEIIRLKLLRKIKRLGFEYDHISYAHYRIASKKFLGTKLVGLKNIVEEYRLIKNANEIQSIKKAVAITDKVFTDILPMIRPNVTEIDLAAEITYRQKKYGAEQVAFDPIVLSGKRTSLIHGQPSSKKIKKGEFVLLDFGCRVHGYNSDMTRTVAVGRPTGNMKKIYSAVLEAQHLGIETTKANIEAKKVDHIIRKYFDSLGLKKYFTHSSGHGVGLEVHESPRIASTSTDNLKIGNVITLEPGVYIPNVGGIRIEDDVLVTEKGCEVLNKSSKELIVL